MGLVYVGKAPAAADPCVNGPSGWDAFWAFPGPPWPPGWPIPQPVGVGSGYSVSVSIPALIGIGAQFTVTSTILDNGIADTGLACHNFVIQAFINGVQVNVSTDNATWVSSLNATISGSAMSQAIYVQGGSNGDALMVQTCVNSVTPALCGTATATLQSLAILAAVSNDGFSMYSNDAVTWTLGGGIEANLWTGLCFSPELKMYVAVAETGTNRVAYSIDGISWINMLAAEQNSWASICWATGLGLFVAVSFDGTHRVMTWDGNPAHAWIARTAAEANQWLSICWSPSLGLLCAVSQTGVHRVMTSSDGVTWNTRTISAQVWRGVGWSSALSIFVAASSTGGVQPVATSVDGTNWTLRTGADISLWQFVVASPTAVVEIAPGLNFGTNQIQASTNGTSWAAMAAPENNTWNSVTFSASLGLFVCVAQSGTHRVMTWDGNPAHAWASHSAASAKQWQGIAASA